MVGIAHITFPGVFHQVAGATQAGNCQVTTAGDCQHSTTHCAWKEPSRDAGHHMQRFTRLGWEIGVCITVKDSIVTRIGEGLRGVHLFTF